MNVLKKSLLLGACVAAFTFVSVNQASAQRGGFDPAQFKQQRLDSIHEKLTMDDKDWSAIEPLVGKVMDAEFAYRAMEMRGLRGSFGRSRRNRDGGDTNNASSQRTNRSPFGEPSATAEALQKAVDDKVPASELKAKLAAYRAEIKEKQDALAAAQEELKGVLTSRQEAIMVLNGVLK